MTKGPSFVRLLVLALTLTLSTSSPRAQQARDTVVAPAAFGTSAIAGTVVSDDSSRRPLRHVTVTLSMSGTRVTRLTATDDQGRFLFADLPDGACTIVATKPGYLIAYYGSRRAGRGPATSVAIAAGQRVLDLVVPMTHGGVIAGTVYDQNGRPQQGLRVTAYAVRTVNGERRVSPAGGTTLSTDDHGDYRIWGLPAGTYLVGTTPVNTAGAAGPTRLITDADMQWAEHELQQSAPGNLGGRRPASPAPDAGHAVGYSIVYAPGVVDVMAATPATIAAGEEHDGLDLTMQLVPTATIDGHVVGPDGQAWPNTSVNLVSRRTDGAEPLAGRSTDRDGRFSFPSVTPGAYTLWVRQAGRPAAALRVFTVDGSPAPPAPPAPPPPPALSGPTGAATLWASEDVSVNGDDISNLVLSLRPGMTVSGRATFDGPTGAPNDLTLVRVGLSPLGTPGLSITVSPRPAANDGTFSIVGVEPGHYRVNALVGAPTGSTSETTGKWYLRSALWHGHDVLDSTLDVEPNEDISDLELVFGDRQTTLSGTILDAAGQVADGYVVIAFPVDRSLWLENSRRIRQSTPGPGGKFTFNGLPPGEYYLGALTDLEPGDLSDPTFLEEVAGASMRVTLAEGETKLQNLKLGGGR